MPKKKVTGIYLIRCLSSGKRYVGSSVDVFLRWRQHRNSLRAQTHGNVHLQRAWNIHGEENFEFKMLYFCTPLRLVELEEHYIRVLGAADPSRGYNLEKIVNGRQVVSAETRTKLSVKAEGRRHTEATKQKLRDKNSMQNPETRAKVSAAMKGRKPWIAGRRHTEETRAKMSAAKKGKPNWAKGVAKSAEQRERMAVAHAAWLDSLTTEQRQQLIAPARAKANSPEARAKISASLKKAWAARKAARDA